MTNWVPVVDQSEHQGATSFVQMRSRGVRGLILRISHGLKLDARVEQYYPQAVVQGFDPDDIGFYPFLNPKRGSAADTAEFAVEAIWRITGRPDFLYMIDVENYKDQTPDKGSAPVFGPQYAAYIREHIANVKALSPKSRVIGYTNRAYWNGKIYKGSVIEWVGDDQLAASLDWIVARYPVYSPSGYASKPLPPDTRGWDEWAFKVAPDGPFPPRGADGWQAWQFSAGWNGQGPAYGVSSDDLDLNIVHPDAWARWTGKTTPPPFPPPIPSPEDDVITINDIYKDAETQADKFVLMLNGKLRPIGQVELRILGIPLSLELGKPLTKADRDALGLYSDSVGAPDPRVDRLEAVTSQLNEAVGRTGQVVGDIQKGLGEAANARA